MGTLRRKSVPGKPVLNTPTRKRRDEKKAQSRQAIIDATISCIAEHGLAGVTISRICSESRLSRGMVNAHFESKDNLLLEVLRSIAEAYRAAADDAIEGTEDNPAEALHKEIDAEITFWMRSHTEARAWFAFRAAALSNPDYLKYCGPRDMMLNAVPGRLAAELINQEGYDDVDPEQVAYGLSALLEGLWFDWVSYPEQFDKEDARAGCLRFLRGYFPRHF